uniref:Ycf80 n=2 Tax=Gelidium TaxID=2811 RepID=A0A411FST0_9FLOR|nr:hypothetical protein [Gelidium coulteri]YP_009565245.1 hypothetical protein [Gelidium sinicola]QBA96196.1 hypothetical protein [Gelidium coulteri]QBA96596.1 hypothetical protein [Gelidium sinicola]
MVFSNLILMSIGNIFVDFLKTVEVHNYDTTKFKEVDFNKYKLAPKVVIKTDNVPWISSKLTKYFKNQGRVQNTLESTDLISSNFINKLINRYWQETIFISPSSSITDKYINLLRLEGIDNYNTQHKDFMVSFSKALALGRIRSSSVRSSIYSNNKTNTSHVKYIWTKGFNVPLINYLIKYFKQNGLNSSYKDFLFISQLKDYGLPLFTIVNEFNQLVIAEPPDSLLGKKNWIDLLYDKLTRYTHINMNLQPTYQGLFFVNSNDALEYKKYMRSKYLTINNDNNLNIFSSRLDVYYKLHKYPSSQIHFILIPDLKELGLLMFKYRYYRNIMFHQNQLWNRTFFQGQPVYIINSVKVKNKVTKRVDLVNYNYLLGKVNDSKKTVFMNYETAICAWKRFKEKMKMYDLPAKPKITVYNIESLIKEHGKQNQNIDQQLFFIPAQESYNFIKQQNRNIVSKNVLDKIYKRLIPVQIIAKRIIWSLTSRQPVNW